MIETYLIDMMIFSSSEGVTTWFGDLRIVKSTQGTD